MSSKATEIAKNLPTLEHPDGSPIRALVVDDEEMLKELVSMGLKMIGWEVQSAGDGPAALAIARDWRPDVLVLDIMMPGFDGLELLDRIRKFYPEVPCLFLTAKDSVDNRIEGACRWCRRLCDQAVFDGRGYDSSAQAGAALGCCRY